MLTPIDKLSPLTPISPEKNAQEAGSPVEESVFGAIFRSAIDNVKETDADFKEAQYLLATGQLDNPAMAMSAAESRSNSVTTISRERPSASM